MRRRIAGPPPHADGIVVLTGGADRIEAALRLLSNGDGDRLLVSGTGGGANLNDLARSAGIDPGPLAGRVTLGRGAATTHGNAAETASWAQQAGLHSLIVVTAAYHMPRALTEIGRALPGVRLYPAPVQPPGILGADGWPTAAGLRLLVRRSRTSSWPPSLASRCWSLRPLRSSRRHRSATTRRGEVGGGCACGPAPLPPPARGRKGRESVSIILHSAKRMKSFVGLQEIEWAVLGDHSGGSMMERTLRRRYSSSFNP